MSNKKKKTRRFWSTDEEQFLRENYQKMTALQIGEKLGRSWGSVNSRAEKLGLRKMTPSRGHWSSKETEKAIEMYQKGVPVREIAKAVGRGYRATCTKLSERRGDAYCLIFSANVKLT